MMMYSSLASRVADGAVTAAIYATCACFTFVSTIIILVFSIILSIGISDDSGSGHFVDKKPSYTQATQQTGHFDSKGVYQGGLPRWDDWTEGSFKCVGGSRNGAFCEAWQSERYFSDADKRFIKGNCSCEGMESLVNESVSLTSGSTSATGVSTAELVVQNGQFCTDWTCQEIESKQECNCIEHKETSSCSHRKLRSNGESSSSCYPRNDNNFTSSRESRRTACNTTYATSRRREGGHELQVNASRSLAFQRQMTSRQREPSSTPMEALACLLVRCGPTTFELDCRGDVRPKKVCLQWECIFVERSFTTFCSCDNDDDDEMPEAPFSGPSAQDDETLVQGNSAQDEETSWWLLTNNYCSRWHCLQGKVKENDYRSWNVENREGIGKVLVPQNTSDFKRDLGKLTDLVYNCTKEWKCTTYYMKKCRVCTVIGGFLVGGVMVIFMFPLVLAGFKGYFGTLASLPFGLTAAALLAVFMGGIRALTQALTPFTTVLLLLAG